MAVNTSPEAVDQLQDLEVPTRMPRPWTALRRGFNFKDDKDSLPPITAARFRRQRKAQAADESEQGQRKPMKVTRHQSLRQPGDDVERRRLEDDLDTRDTRSPRLSRASRPQSPAARAGQMISNLSNQMSHHLAVQHAKDYSNAPSTSNKSIKSSKSSNKSQYESDSDFIGSSESSTNDAATDAIDELCSNSAKLTSEIMDMIHKTSTESIPAEVLLNQRPKTGLRRSVSLNDRTGSARKRFTTQISVPNDVNKAAMENPKAPKSTTSRPHSAWTDYSKSSRPISGRPANEAGQSGNVYEQEYINNDHLDGWSDTDSDWSSDGSWEGLDSGYDNENDDKEIKEVEKRGEEVSAATKACQEQSQMPKTSCNRTAQNNTQNNVQNIAANNNAARKSRSTIMNNIANENSPPNSQDTTPRNPQDVQDKPATPRSSRKLTKTPQQERSRSNPPPSRVSMSPSRSSMRVEDWLITCREQKVKPLTCLPDIVVKNSPR